MKKYFISIIMAVMSLTSMANSQGWPANYSGVMLQAFWWDSYEATQWTALTNRADELSQYFDLIWIPNAGTTANFGKTQEMGYMPCYWLGYDTCFGTQAELFNLIDTYKAKGTGIIEDVVINHKNGFMSWCNFPDETNIEGRKSGKTYSITWDNTNYSGICCTDECNSNGYTTTGASDTGDDFNGCRDLDHTNATVQNNIKTYCDFMLNEVGFAGFRYDMVKGYSSSYTALYNNSCDVEFSVGEYWDSSDNIKNWINGTGKTSAAFDFPLKYNIHDYFDGGCSDAGKLQWMDLAADDTYKRYAVTFVDNHDTGRTDGNGSSPLYNNWSAANAYILAIPGTPCVWLKHYNADPTNIGAMILARKAAGITNMSSSTWNGASVVTTGTNGKVYACFGSGASSANPGSEYTLVASGDNYSFWSTAVSAKPSVTFSQAGSSFKTESLSLTLTPKNAVSAWYQIGTGAKTTFAEATTITIGADAAYGDQITVSWGATDEEGTEVTSSETYTKKDPSAVTYVYFNNSSSWSNVYVYNWKKNSTSSVATWPGTKLSETTSEGYYKYEISDDDYNMIIFNDGGSNQTDDLAVVADHLYSPAGDQGAYTPGGSGGGGEVDAPTFEGYRVYLNNTSSWATPYCYSWNSTNTKISGSWPGSAMTKDETTGYYYIDFTEEPANVIFTNKGSNQTKDLTFNNGYLYSCDGSSKAYATQVVTPPVGNDVVSVEGLSMKVGETSDLTINFKKVHSISQMSFKVELPANVEYQDITITDRLSAHAVSVLLIEDTDNSYAVTILSDDNAEISDAEGALLSLSVKATAEGEGEVSISSITAATNGTTPERYTLEDAIATVTVTAPVITNPITIYKGSAEAVTIAQSEWATVRESYPNAIAVVGSDMADWAENQTNVVVEYQVTSNTKAYECPNFVLTDRQSGATVDFYSPVDFIAISGQYTRTFNDNTSSCCLPFEFSTTDFSSSVDILTFAYYEPVYENGELTDKAYAFFNKRATIGAGIPCLIYAGSNKAPMIKEFANTRIVGKPENSTSMQGTFRSTSDYMTEGYYGMSSNRTQLADASNSVLGAFRSLVCLKYDTEFNGGSNHSTSSSAKPSTIEIGIIDEDGNVTGIDGVIIKSDSASDKNIYTIEGIKVESISRAGIYIVNGKKVVIK